MGFVLSFRTNEISQHPCTTKLRFRSNVNYELKVYLGFFLLCIALIFKISVQWVIFPCSGASLTKHI